MGAGTAWHRHCSNANEPQDSRRPLGDDVQALDEILQEPAATLEAA